MNGHQTNCHTPPPPLQPIVDETLNGLYHYFGQQPPQPPAPTLSSIRLVTNNMQQNGQIQQQQQQQPQQPIFSFSREVTASLNLQEKKHTLNRKLAQRTPKHELVERGILPRKINLFVL